MRTALAAATCTVAASLALAKLDADDVIADATEKGEESPPEQPSES